MSEKEKLIIFDTTLRDGEQSPGASMTPDQKATIAGALDRLGVDVIEAGFPIASPDEFTAVQRVARSVRHSRVCGLARAKEGDIERAAECLQGATAPVRIHTFIATSPIHMQAKLRMQPEQVLEQAVRMVKLARHRADQLADDYAKRIGGSVIGGDVEFSPEDAGRSELDFLCRVIEAVIDAGATTINIPDTVGYTLPHQFGTLMSDLIERVPNADQAIFSVHCHDDLGLGVANSLAAVMSGARQVECTINGLGERAGNAALEEVVMAVRTRQDQFDCDTRLDTTQLGACSRLVAEITRFDVPRNKAIVGANAFAHESGIHQDGVLKQRETYEIMRAEQVGWDGTQIVLGKHSGRNAIKDWIRRHYPGHEERVDEIFPGYKLLLETKPEVHPVDLHALMSDLLLIDQEREGPFQLGQCDFDVTGETGLKRASASVKMSVHGEERAAQGEGDGAICALINAIKSGLLDPALSGREIVEAKEADLVSYAVKAVTPGSNAEGEVFVTISSAGGRYFSARGFDQDVATASAHAYVNALNKLVTASSSARHTPSAALEKGDTPARNAPAISAERGGIILERCTFHAHGDRGEERAHANVEMLINGERYRSADAPPLSGKEKHYGDGAIDALFNAINAAVGHALERSLKGVVLESYSVKATTPGQDAQGEVTVTLSDGGRYYPGRGIDDDVATASAKAYVDALNRWATLDEPAIEA